MSNRYTFSRPTRDDNFARRREQVEDLLQCALDHYNGSALTALDHLRGMDYTERLRQYDATVKSWMTRKGEINDRIERCTSEAELRELLDERHEVDIRVPLENNRSLAKQRKLLLRAIKASRYAAAPSSLDTPANPWGGSEEHRLGRML